MDTLKYFVHVALSLFVIFFLSMAFQVEAADVYEEDNTNAQAGVIVINDTQAQQHDLHTPNDQDWVKFYGLASTTYQVEVTGTGSGIDPVIELFDQDGNSLLESSNVNGPGVSETLLWFCPTEGIFFVRIRHDTSSSYSTETGYRLELITPDLLSLPGFLTGTITNSLGQQVDGARIKLSGSAYRGSALSTPDGSYVAGAMSGSYTVSVSAVGHLAYSRSGVKVPGSLNIVLTRINQAPVAIADSYTVSRGGTQEGNVLENDSDGDGDPLTAVLVSGVLHGKLNFNTDGTFVYTHNGENVASDSFRYYATDGRSASRTVTVNIKIDNKGHLPTLLLLLKE